MPAQWTAACLSDDLPPGVVTPGVCNGSDVVVWRSASGKVSAWNDRCQHRGMRLSHGFVRGETLSCIYHGWVYGTGGVCKSIPAHPNLAPPEAIRAQTFSCVESNGIVWMAEAGADGAPPEVGELTPVRSLVIVGSAKLLQQALPAGFQAVSRCISGRAGGTGWAGNCGRFGASIAGGKPHEGSHLGWTVG